MWEKITGFFKTVKGWFTKDNLKSVVKIGGGVMAGTAVMSIGFMPFYGIVGGVLLAIEVVVTTGGLLAGIAVASLIMGYKAA
jgi:hypothetical protein